MRRSLLGLATLSTVLMARGELYSLKDAPEARPGLVSTEEAQPLSWWDGGPAFALASAGAVRVNYRGVLVYPATARIRDVFGPSSASIAGWHGRQCNASAWALCSSDVGDIFPSKAPRMPERHAAVKADGWNDLSCSQSKGKILTDKGVYDISACDVFDEGLDVLYSRGYVSHRHSAIPVWEYWTLVILAIILVRFFSYNVQSLWEAGGKPETVQGQLPPLIASFVLLVLVLIRGDSAYVTSADQLFFWSTTAYILIYLAMHLWARCWGGKQDKEQGDGVEEEQEGGCDKAVEETRAYERPVYNIIVATLQLVATRFYNAAETPYNIVLLGMLACRGW
jgi:hypothetical protein